MKKSNTRTAAPNDIPEPTTAHELLIGKSYTAPPIGLLVKDLQHGYLYKCRLSHHAILVLDEDHVGPDPHDPRKQVKKSVRRGRYFNAVYGVYAWCELVDRQLVAFAAPVSEGK